MSRNENTKRSKQMTELLIERETPQQQKARIDAAVHAAELLKKQEAGSLYRDPLYAHQIKAEEALLDTKTIELGTVAAAPPANAAVEDVSRRLNETRPN